MKTNFFVNVIKENFYKSNVLKVILGHQIFYNLYLTLSLKAPKGLKVQERTFMMGTIFYFHSFKIKHKYIFFVFMFRIFLFGF